jgi:hypothetical protein
MKLHGGESFLCARNKRGLRVGKSISRCVVRHNYSTTQQRGQRTMLSLLVPRRLLVPKQRLERPRWVGSRLLHISRKRNGILKDITSDSSALYDPGICTGTMMHGLLLCTALDTSPMLLVLTYLIATSQVGSSSR